MKREKRKGNPRLFIILLTILCCFLFGCGGTVYSEKTNETEKMEEVVEEPIENNIIKEETLILYYPNGEKKEISFNYTRKYQGTIDGNVYLKYYNDNDIICRVYSGLLFYDINLDNVEDYKTFSGTFDLKSNFKYE